MLKQLDKLVQELATTNSSNEKIEILKQYPDCTDLLELTYNPYKKFHITSQQLDKHKDLVSTISHTDIRALLEELRTRELTGHKAIEAVNSFISAFHPPVGLVENIIDKDLKCRINESTINKAFPGLIPEFDVALANSYDKVKNIKVDDGSWFWSRKLDGVRCITRIDSGNITFYSRKGHAFETLGVLKDHLKSLSLEDCVLDGEICLVDENGHESFQGIMKEIKKKDHTIKNPKYLVFDRLTLEEFDSKESTRSLISRLDTAKTHINFDKSNYMDLVQQDNIMCMDEFEEAVKLASDQGWEGLILRKNVGYKGKRSNDLLKIKKFYDEEYIVKSTEIGEIDDGKGNKLKGMTAVNISHKGYTVKVGSGWSYIDRIKYYYKPEKIIGKTITVQYFEETENDKGGISLRFPTVKYLHSEEREI